MLKKSPLANAAGALNNYVTVEQASDADPNASEEVLPEFSVLCQRFASAEITGGREFQTAMSTYANVNSVMELPYDPVTATITARDRLNMDGRILNIVRAYNQGNNNEKIILWLIEPE